MVFAFIFIQFDSLAGSPCFTFGSVVLNNIYASLTDWSTYTNSNLALHEQAMNLNSNENIPATSMKITIYKNITYASFVVCHLVIKICFCEIRGQKKWVRHKRNNEKHLRRFAWPRGEINLVVLWSNLKYLA